MYSIIILLLFGERKFFIVILFKEKNYIMEYIIKWFLYKCIIFLCFLKIDFKIDFEIIVMGLIF